MAKGNGSTRASSPRMGEQAQKAVQLAVINESNPMRDDYHTGIRSVDDIKTWGEAVSIAQSEARDGGWDEISSYPDVTNDMILEAQRTGKIVVYSSNPIANGNFVTPSRMQAEDYAGGGKIYSQEVSISDVAWINVDEGQFAKPKRR